MSKFVKHKYLTNLIQYNRIINRNGVLRMELSTVTLILNIIKYRTNLEKFITDQISLYRRCDDAYNK